MTTSDLLSGIAIFVSLFTLAGTIYFQFLMPPRVRVAIGDDFQLFYTYDRQLLMLCNLTFFNLGARYAGALVIKGELADTKGQRLSTFHWDSFFKARNIAKPGTPFRIWHDFDGELTTIVIPGYQAVNKSIIFMTDNRVRLEPGKYRIVFNVFLLPRPLFRRSITYRASVTLSEKNARLLNRYCHANRAGLSKQMLRLSLNIDQSRPESSTPVAFLTPHRSHRPL